MPRYSFRLRDDDGEVEDDAGVNLPDVEIAYRYACDVVQELMKHRELRTRSWQLEVFEAGEKVFEIAAYDRRTSHVHEAGDNTNAPQHLC